MADSELESRLEVALAATREAAATTLSWFQNPNLAIRTKADASPVTAADLAAEEILGERLLAAFPDDAFLACYSA